MDLYCQRCGEPWDFWHVNDEMSPEEKRDFKEGKCCPACKGKPAPRPTPFRAQLASAFSDVLGDDIDGIAAEMEDAEAMLGAEFWD